MQITIEHQEKKIGLLIKKTEYHVRVGIKFSNEELAIIKQRNLDKVVVDEWDHVGGFPIEQTIGMIVRNSGYSREFLQLVDARQYEVTLKEQILPNLKKYIQLSADDAPKSNTFEL